MPFPDHVTAGYLLARPGNRNEGFNDPDLIPPRVTSAAHCMSDGLMPEGWWLARAHGETDASRAEQAEELGIDASRVPTLVAWLTARVAAGDAPDSGLLADVDLARELARLAASRFEDFCVLGLALPRGDVERFLAECASPQGCPGLAAAVARGVAPAEGGVRLGHEPLNFAYGHRSSCSWLCNAAEKGVHEALGIRTNANGLIESADDAIRASRWIGEDESRGEPGPWFPFLLIRYDD